MSSCKFDAQGIFKCTNEIKPNDVARTFEKFSIASDAVMAYAANKCPENYKKPAFDYVAEEQMDIAGFDPAMFNHQNIVNNL